MTVIESYEGEHRDYRWKITCHEVDSITEQYGDLTFSIFDDKTGLYTERHTSQETTVDALESRACDVIDQINDDETISICEACGKLYPQQVNKRQCKQELSWADRHIFTHGLDPRYKASIADDPSETCVWTTGFIFDTVHIVTHHQDTNPFFEESELVETDSLIMCKGFERIYEDGEVRSYEEIEEKRQGIQREQALGQKHREKQDDLLELLDWVLKREDRFYTKSRFKHQH